jgi:hypothetical protein
MPRKSLASVLVGAVLLLTGLSASGQAPVSVPERDPIDPDTGLPVLDEVLVTGSQPGPGMWRISHGENTL